MDPPVEAVQLIKTNPSNMKTDIDSSDLSSAADISTPLESKESVSSPSIPIASNNKNLPQNLPFPHIFTFISH